MIFFRNFLITIFFVCFFFACKNEQKSSYISESISIDSLFNARYQRLLEYPVDSLSFPRSFTRSTNSIKKKPSQDWTSGFLPGNFWYLYRLTGNEVFKDKAAEWTQFIEKEKYNDGTHDMGFKVFCSFGNGYQITGNERYKRTIIESAKTLSTRFNENIGCIRSWDWNRDVWEYPVIIDNMMNLELLFEATRMSKDSSFHKIAIKHANTTLKNHFRADNSSFHVVVYDSISGKVKDKVTHQGYSNKSAWSRGQAWGIYGFTMSYRYTKDPAYLAQAQASANFFINHSNLPEDGIPYWDFNDPKIPNAPRDVSAAAITASALVELAKYSNNNPDYINYTEKVLKSLRSERYVLPAKFQAPFILDHSTGYLPGNGEIDEPIIYGDYYFLEALFRAKNQ